MEYFIETLKKNTSTFKHIFYTRIIDNTICFFTTPIFKNIISTSKNSIATKENITPISKNIITTKQNCSATKKNNTTTRKNRNATEQNGISTLKNITPTSIKLKQFKENKNLTSRVVQLPKRLNNNSIKHSRHFLNDDTWKLIRYLY